MPRRSTTSTCTRAAIPSLRGWSTRRVWSSSSTRGWQPSSRQAVAGDSYCHLVRQKGTMSKYLTIDELNIDNQEMLVLTLQHDVLFQGRLGLPGLEIES